MSSLKAKLIRLAHEKPGLRKDLLPLLKEAKGQPMAFALSHGDDKEIEQMVDLIIGKHMRSREYSWDVRRGVGGVLALYITVTHGPVTKKDFKIAWSRAFGKMLDEGLLDAQSLNKNLQQALRSGNIV